MDNRFGLEALSFVRKTKDGLKCWAVDGSSLSYQQRNQLGEQLAREALQHVRETGFTPLLGWIVRDMELFDGVAVGFAEYICAHAAGLRRKHPVGIENKGKQRDETK